MKISQRLSSIVGRVLLASALLAGVVVSAVAPASAASSPMLTFINRTTANGLGNNVVYGVAVVGSTVYAATENGLSISTDGGTTFTNRTTADGLVSNWVWAVFAAGSTVYAGMNGGLSISTDGGTSFTNRTTANGLGWGIVNEIRVDGSTVYVATESGLSISTDGGTSFTNKTSSSGLGGNGVKGVYVVGSTVYAATGEGLSISTDGGTSFTNRTTADGLGGNFVKGVYVVGSTVYAATASESDPSAGGLSVSNDGGATFVNRTTADGLGGNYVFDVYVVGSTVYAATYSPTGPSGGGLGVSYDGGATFANHTTTNGLGSNFVIGVVVVGSTVYASTTGGLSTSSLPSSVATLSDLSLSTGSLSPSFASATSSYTASVSNATSSMTVTPTVTNSSATVKVNGVTTTSGSASGAISLSVGENAITVVVTAADGTTTGTYTVTVTRAEPSAPVGSGVASPAAAVNGTVSLSPSSGTSAGTNFSVSLNGSSSCPGDGAAGYRWRTFLIDSSVDLQTVQFDATGPVPSLPADSSKFSAALFDTSSVKVLAQTPSPSTGVVTGIPTMSFVGNGAVPDGTYHLGVACTNGSAGTSQLKSLWSTVVTFSNSGANWNQNTEFTPVTPVRIYDTRPGFTGLRDVTKMRVGPATPLCVTISGVGGIPTTASAVAMNVVATDTAGPGFLTVYPGGVTRPVASSVNYVSSDITSNGVITALDSSGVACVYSMVPAHVVVDVTGWFPAGSSFTSVTPARVVDTRPGQPDGLRAVPKARIGPTNTVEAQLTNLGPGGAIVPGTGVEAVALNVTVTESAGGGFVTVYACGTRPETSSVNFTAGQIIPNSVITQVSGTGTICVHSSIDAHVIVDVVGWFSDTGTYTAVAPVRMADTRASEAAGLRPVNKVKIGPAITPTINFTNIGPLPASVRAVSLNVTVDGTTGPGFITAYPCGTRPPTSSLNYTAANMTKANAMIIPVSGSGDMCLYSMTGTDIVVDLVGYFT